jgi:hypothetical protein
MELDDLRARIIQAVDMEHRTAAHRRTARRLLQEVSLKIGSFLRRKSRQIRTRDRVFLRAALSETKRRASDL